MKKELSSSACDSSAAAGEGCNPIPQSLCSFNGKHDYKNDDSVTAYQESKVAFGANCKSELRICNSGVFSGSYKYASCEQDLPTSCTTDKPQDSSVTKLCSSIGPTYFGKYTEKTAYVCQGTSWVLGPNHDDSDKERSCTRSCPGSKPQDSSVTKLCSSIGPTYFGKYTEKTAYVCQGTSWVLGPNHDDSDKERSCTRSCPANKPQDSSTGGKSCSELLGKNYGGNYTEYLTYTCSSDTWSWKGSLSNNANSVCQIRKGVCGPNIRNGSWDNDFNKNPTAWCDVGNPVNTSGAGVPGNPLQWQCKLEGGDMSDVCKSNPCTSIGLKAGFIPGSPKADSTMLSVDNFAGFTNLIKGSQIVQYNLILGCNACSEESDPVGAADRDKILGATNYDQWYEAFKGAVSNRGISQYISVTKGERFNWSGWSGYEIVLTLTQPDLYFVSAPSNGWFMSGLTSSGSMRTEVRCIGSSP